MSVGFLHYVKALACPVVFTASAVSCAASAATPPPDAGVLIYSRPVFKAAEVRGEPATPNQVELTAAIPWQGSLQPMTALTDDEALWAVLRGPLQQWAEAPPASTAFPQPEALAEFTSVYADHIAREEGRAYPLARTLLDTATLSQMGAEMSARRHRPATGTP